MKISSTSKDFTTLWEIWKNSVFQMMKAIKDKCKKYGAQFKIFKCLPSTDGYIYLKTIAQYIVMYFKIWYTKILFMCKMNITTESISKQLIWIHRMSLYFLCNTSCKFINTIFMIYWKNSSTAKRVTQFKMLIQECHSEDIYLGWIVIPECDIN